MLLLAIIAFGGYFSPKGTFGQWVAPYALLGSHQFCSVVFSNFDIND